MFTSSKASLVTPLIWWKTFVGLIATTVLNVMGWHKMHKATLESLKQETGNLVLVMQHTSYWDFAVGLLYMYSEGLQDRLVFIMTSYILEKYWYVAPLLRCLPCIFVPSINDKNQGSTDVVIQMLKNKRCCNMIILIAPNGSVKGSQHPNWRSGYYYIARGVKALIGTIGINYHPMIRTVHLGTQAANWLDPLQHSRERIEPILRSNVGTIYPKFPHESTAKVYTPRNLYNSEIFFSKNYQRIAYSFTPSGQTYLVDMIVFTSFLFVLPILCCFQAGMYDLALAGTVAAFASIKYHLSYEQDQMWRFIDVRVSYSVIMYFFFRLIVWSSWNTVVAYSLAWLSCLQLYMNGSKREQAMYRKPTYTLFHSVFHLMISTVIMWYCYNSGH